MTSEPPNKELWMNYQKQTRDIICMQTIVKRETTHSGKDTLLYSVAKRQTWKFISVKEFYFDGLFFNRIKSQTIGLSVTFELI